jgi:hypothetical protein
MLASLGCTNMSVVQGFETHRDIPYNTSLGMHQSFVGFLLATLRDELLWLNVDDQESQHIFIILLSAKLSQVIEFSHSNKPPIQLKNQSHGH